MVVEYIIYYILYIICYTSTREKSIQSLVFRLAVLILLFSFVSKESHIS